MWRGAGTGGAAADSAVGATAEAGTGGATARAVGQTRAVTASPAERPRYPRNRAVAVWILGIAGLVAYNWWLLVPLKPGLMTSPDELFSNLEITGQPYAALMQHCDLASGLLLVAAFAFPSAVAFLSAFNRR